ncbi:unnamed protein product [Strongylus vulgaris]|uniref:Uncharacterized protein n=1 Tax=Strongylus vulgaris TaxID=40348 RepID=A0A3P7KRP9_STRVU|nr:unnamed protein product [Strongylus vulgaris]
MSMSRSRGPSHASSIGDGDDFPDLCEELDEDAMRRAAAAAVVKNIVLSEESPADVTSPPFSCAEKTIQKTHESSFSQKDSSPRKFGEDAALRHSCGIRHEDGRFRQSSCPFYSRIATRDDDTTSWRKTNANPDEIIEAGTTQEIEIKWTRLENVEK